MKRVFALVLALCMACALFACGKKQTEVAPGGDSPTVTPGATDPGSGPAENPGRQYRCARRCRQYRKCRKRRKYHRQYRQRLGRYPGGGDLFLLHRQHPDGGGAHPGHDRGGPV